MRLFSSFLSTLSITGILVGLLLFCASLTPSLLPRVPLVQGALAGVAFGVGYGIGTMALSVWRFFEVPVLTGSWRRGVSVAALGLGASVAATTLARMSEWQNSIHTLMEMPPVDSGYPFTVLGVALLTGVILLIIIRGILRLGQVVSAWVNRILPRRISIGLGSVLVAVLLGSLFDGLVLRRTLVFLDQTFAEVDRMTDAGVQAPPEFSDTDAVLRWADVGRNGKRFLTAGPSRADIEGFTGRAARQPIRVYSGLNTTEDLQERAAATVAELKRQGGFERSVLVVASPTGTGWLDPGAMQPLPYLHGGDLAIVSMQYSYLPSWLTLIVDPGRSARASRALFREVFSHWKTLPKDQRPRLYLFGLSLGALGSEASSDLVELLADPIDGAFWAGPPFASSGWPRLTRNREAGSPEWRPLYRDGSMVRFMTQDGFADASFADWGPLRVVYLQHASDPMSFFSANLAFTRPDWLGPNRGRDVSPYFRWFPVVSFLQVGFDIPMATSVSQGYGHNFTPAEYIDGWIAVTEPKNWTKDDTARLKEMFADFSGAPI